MKKCQTEMWQTATFGILLQKVLFHTLDSTPNLVVTTLKAAFTYYCLIISQNLTISRNISKEIWSKIKYTP